MKLHAPTFKNLRLGEIRASGWFQRQLQLQADGLSGNLDTFWPDIRDSQWFGGESEAWERAPYWLDGLIPLAYTLNDESLKSKVQYYMDYILKHQHDDGWFGPKTMVASSGSSPQQHYDLWAQLLFTKVLVQYADATDDARVAPALLRNLRCIERHIDTTPLFNWGQFRWFEALIAIYWLYEINPESWLLDLAVKLCAQGFDWMSYYTAPSGWPSASPTPKGRWNFMSHVVNNAMAVKSPALWWRLTGDPQHCKVVYTILEKLHHHHGMVTGVFSGDECLAGLNPTQGTELCAVVEYAFSLEVLLGIFGDPSFGDHIERIIYNALPATFSPDMWSHQYDQQVNQIECSVRENRAWNTNGPASNTFGVEPNYGCCTANLSQGWPKFASHLWMHTADDGLAATLYAPNKVSTTINGSEIKIELETAYPFDNLLTFTVTTETPVKFPLHFRIPEWATHASISVDSEAPTQPAPGTFYKIERQWQGKTNITLTLPARAQLENRGNGITLIREPLVYALKIGEEWQRINADKPFRELPHADWEVYPTTPWNYALVIDRNDIETSFEFHKRPLSEFPFSPDGTPIEVKCMGRHLPAWKAENGDAQAVPKVDSKCKGRISPLTLIPYGCTNLRITEFPFWSCSPDEIHHT